MRDPGLRQPQTVAVDPEAELLAEPIEFTAEALAVQGPSMLDRIISDPHYASAEAVQKLAATLDLIREVAIKATFPEDWVLHESESPDGERRTIGYLGDDGCQRAIPVWGMARKLYGPPVRESMEDGTYLYRVRGAARCFRTGLVVEEIGSRWSGQDFFRKLAERRGSKVVDPTLVEKAAIKNLDGRLFRYLAGLNTVPLAALARCFSEPQLKRATWVRYGGARRRREEERDPHRGPAPIPAAAPPGTAHPLTPKDEVILYFKTVAAPEDAFAFWKKLNESDPPMANDPDVIAAKDAAKVRLKVVA